MRESKAEKRRVKLERTYDATIDDVWELWTTKDGIESWWGPNGFAVKVRSIDLRPGGELHYEMRAVSPEMIAGMKAMGAPLAREHVLTFVEVVPKKRLVYDHLVDFADTTPYDVTHTVELHEVAKGVRLVLTFDAMHADLWTERATMGWTQELEKLAAAIE